MAQVISAICAVIKAAEGLGTLVEAIEESWEDPFSKKGISKDQILGIILDNSENGKWRMWGILEAYQQVFSALNEEVSHRGQENWIKMGSYGSEKAHRFWNVLIGLKLFESPYREYKPVVHDEVKFLVYTQLMSLLTIIGFKDTTWKHDRIMRVWNEELSLQDKKRTYAKYWEIQFSYGSPWEGGLMSSFLLIHDPKGRLYYAKCKWVIGMYNCSKTCADFLKVKIPEYIPGDLWLPPPVGLDGLAVVQWHKDHPYPSPPRYFAFL